MCDKGGSVDVRQCNCIYTIIEQTPTTASQTSLVSRYLLHLWPSLHKARQFECVASTIPKSALANILTFDLLNRSLVRLLHIFFLWDSPPPPTNRNFN